jgi:hypothetical protein
MRKLLLGFALVLVLAFGFYVYTRPSAGSHEFAYAGGHHVTVWSTSAQVREQIGTLNYGDRLEVLQRFQDLVKIKAPDGLTGWIQERDVMSTDVWQTVRDLETKAEGMPVEAVGHTRVLGNLHIGPGRDTPRIRQLGKDVHLDVLARQPSEIPVAATANTDNDAGAAPPDVKKEDWWLVRAKSPDEGAQSGWLLGRFIDLDVPAPLPDYASSAGMRIVAWFELNYVKDASGAQKPQFLLVGTHGAEGQVCDFTLLRVYTWAVKHDRYETAFIESDLCGKLPIQITRGSAPGADALFWFQDLSGNGSTERKYRLIQTVVRRVSEDGQPPRKQKR